MASEHDPIERAASRAGLDVIGWGVVVFFFTQLTQIGIAGLIMAIGETIRRGNLDWAASSFGVALFGYLVIASKTGYPLAALVLSACYRHGWAATAHLVLTLLIFVLCGVSLSRAGYSVAVPLFVALIIAPLLGYVVFRAVSALTRPAPTPPPPTP